jgi:5-formyltetrahydrofolate cyclo-ligase
MKVETAKDRFRRECHKLLRVAKKRSYKKDKVVNSYLYELISQDRVRDVMLYIPLGNEVDINPLIGHLRRQKINIWVPFMEGKSFRLVKYRYPLRIKKYGVKEPKNSYQFRKKTIDLAVVPIIGIDSTRRRVGFGKGMYDRFFEKEIKNIKKVIFVARELCYSRDVVTDDYDVECDVLVTSRGVNF